MWDAGSVSLFVSLKNGHLYLKTINIIKKTSMDNQNKTSSPKSWSEMSKKQKIVAIIAIIFIGVSLIVIFRSGVSTTPSVKSPYVQSESEELKIGDTGYLKSNDDTVMLGVTKDNYNQLMKLSVAKDTEGVLQMVLNGQAILADSGTKIRVIDEDMFIKQVRFLDGKYYGQSGWTPNEFVSNVSPKLTETTPTNKTTNTSLADKTTVEQKSTASNPQQIVSKSTSSNVYCSDVSDCAGFKIKIDFKEDASCNQVNSPTFPCKYYDSFGQKEIFYLTVTGDIVSGKVRTKNLNSGVEQDSLGTQFIDLMGSYNSSTGELTFTRSFYIYPHIEEGFVYEKHVGHITGNQFSGEYHYSYDGDGKDANVVGDVTYLPISIADKIPKKNCIIKGDTFFSSGGTKTYYTTDRKSVV